MAIYTKSQINKAGLALKLNEADEKAQHILSEWRALHAYPINTFQATLRVKAKKLKLSNYLIAQRLKRMPTIVDKLKRYPSMNLAQMQDIGGLRIVVEDMNEVNKVVTSYENKSIYSRFQHNLIRKKDYINNPRSEDGYRSIHLIYSYKNRVAKNYEGLLLELQVRTKLQHNWATAVETMGIYLNQPLKSRIGKQEWLDFFALVSSAFAHIEKLPLVPRFSKFSKDETFKQVEKAEKELQVLEKLNYFAKAAQVLSEKNKQIGFYHLIILSVENKTISIRSFAKNDFESAKTEYAKAEKRLIKGEKIDPVLVAVGRINQLKRAYPNFFLDTTEFINKIRKIINPD